VTGAGPHSGGGEGDEITRWEIPIPDVARVHGTTVMVFLGVVLVTVFIASRDRAPRAVMRRVTVLLVILVAQAGVGYAQYLSDIPPLLVGIHVAGATAVWTATLWFHLGLSERRPVSADARPSPPVLTAT
jgi:cytochrome c oxidase assembly protein subunit 15